MLGNTTNPATIYPNTFGMLMPNRSFSSSDYSYGFNGKEDNPSWNGDGNMYDYGFRIYNPRLGKFLSVDPLFKSYAELTPYQFASNTPIQAIDLDGLEAKKATTFNPNTGRTLVTITIDIQVKNSSKKISDAEAITHAGNIGEQVKKTFSGTSNESTDVVVKVNITNLEVSESGEVILREVTDEDPFIVEFVDKMNDNGDGLNTGGDTKEIGNTQENVFTILVKSPKEDNVRSSAAIKRTGTHEIGHGLGLRHPFDSENDVKDIKQYNETPAPGVDVKTIQENIMNNGRNTKKLRPKSNNATKSTKGQRTKIVDAVPEK